MSKINQASHYSFGTVRAIQFTMSVPQPTTTTALVLSSSSSLPTTKAPAKMVDVTPDVVRQFLEQTQFLANRPPTQTLVVGQQKPPRGLFPSGTKFCVWSEFNIELAKRYSTIVILTLTETTSWTPFTQLLAEKKNVVLFVAIHQYIGSMNRTNLIRDFGSLKHLFFCGIGRDFGLSHGYNMTLLSLVPEHGHPTKTLFLNA